MLKHRNKQTTNQTVFGALMFVNKVAPIAGDEDCHWCCGTSKMASSNLDLCAKHSCKNLAMTLGSCNVKKEDRVGAGPQKMAVYLFEFTALEACKIPSLDGLWTYGVTVSKAVRLL